MTAIGRTAPRVDPAIWDHPKTRALAEQTGRTVDETVRALVGTLAYVARRNENGVLIRLTARDDADRTLAEIGTAAGVRRPGPWVQALLSVGFVEVDGPVLRVHDWSDWQDLSRARPRGSTGTGNRVTTGSSTGMSKTTGTGNSTGTNRSTGTGSPEEYYRNTERGEEEREGLGERETKSHPFGRFMWWLVDGFGWRKYQRNSIDPRYLQQCGNGVDMALLAECFIAISEGIWGDDFDHRALSARHAMARLNAFASWKRRRGIDATVWPLTEAGRASLDAAAGRGGPVAAGDDREDEPGAGATVLAPGGAAPGGSGVHPKVAAYYARQPGGDGADVGAF